MADLAEDPTRMNLIDSLWLDVKQTEGPVAVGAVLEFEGRAPSIDKIRERVDETLVHAPRLRQKPEHSRTGILQGKWVDDNPDLEQHVTKRKIAKGGLEAEISKLLVTPMDTHRPLWDISVLTGYAPGQWALVWRLHHAVADGEGVTMLVGRTIDMSPDGMVTMTDALVAQADAARAARRGPVDVTLDAGDKLRTALVGAFSDAAAIAAATPATVRALLLVFLGFAGGLTMSAIKRDAGVKDWGSSLAGHGGVLDRIDSLCFSAPILFHLTRWFLPGSV